MPTFDGTVTLGGATVSNATVYVINDTTDTIATVTTTDSTGAYSVTVADGDTYHLAAQYVDGKCQYHALSNPHLSSTRTIDFDLQSYMVPGSSSVDFSMVPQWIIDNFEDGGMGEWSVTRNDGTSSAWGVQTSTVYHGSYAAYIDSENVELQSTSGLPNYPEQGDTFSYRLYQTSRADQTNLRYGLQDANNCYFVRVDPANNNFILYVYNSGSVYNVASKNPSIPTGQWNEVEVVWNTDASHTITLFDASGTQVSQLSYGGGNSNDPQWTDGGVGLDAYYGKSTETAYFDYIHIK